MHSPAPFLLGGPGRAKLGIGGRQTMGTTAQAGQAQPILLLSSSSGHCCAEFAPVLSRAAPPPPQETSWGGGRLWKTHARGGGGEALPRPWVPPPPRAEGGVEFTRAHEHREGSLLRRKTNVGGAQSFFCCCCNQCYNRGSFPTQRFLCLHVYWGVSTPTRIGAAK